MHNMRIKIIYVIRFSPEPSPLRLGESTFTVPPAHP